MSLVKHRPKIKVYLPPVVYPGKTVRSTVDLDALHALSIQFLDVELLGLVFPAAHGTAPGAMESTPLVSLGARLCAAYDIPAGKSRFECEFPIPPGLPPTHRGAILSVAYTLRVHVGVDWWPDAKKGFVVNVGVPPLPRGRPKAPGLYSSAPEGPKGTEPYAELSLTDGAVESGGVIEGAVALGNVAHARYVGLKLSIVGIERAIYWGTPRATELVRYVVHLSVEKPEEGRPIPFRIRVPNAQPSFRSPLLSLTWQLELCAQRRLGRDLEFSVPVTVLAPAENGATERERARPPVVGLARLERVWGSVGEPLGFRLAGEELQARAGEVAIAVRREQRSDGVFLVAELRYPSLGIGLDGGALSGLANWFSERGIELGDERFDKAHRLHGRHERQTRVFLDAMRPALARMPNGARIGKWDDRSCLFEQKGAGLTASQLGPFLASALAIGNATNVARSVIPPPPHFDVESWKRLASELSGTLTVGNMAVEGEVGGHRVSIETEWLEAEPYATELRLSPRSPLDAACHGVLRGRGIEKNTWPEPALGAEALPIARALADRYSEVEIGADALLISLPALEADATPALEVVHDLVRLADLCALKRSAYR